MEDHPDHGAVQRPLLHTHHDHDLHERGGDIVILILHHSPHYTTGWQVVPPAGLPAECIRGRVEEHQRAGRGGVRGEL